MLIFFLNLFLCFFTYKKIKNTESYKVYIRVRKQFDYLKKMNKFQERTNKIQEEEIKILRKLSGIED